MPKLPSAAAAEAKKAAESSGFTPLEEGPYEVRLTDVKATTSKTSNNPMWVWELESVEEGSRGRKLWVNTVLTDKAMWKLGEMFAAFGVDTDADTDELIGDHCIAHVTQRTITQGARAGQIGNDVARCEPIDTDTGEVGNTNAASAGASAGVAAASGEGEKAEGW